MSKSNQPVALSLTFKRRIKHMILSEQATTATEVARVFAKDGVADVFPDTIANALKKQGMKAMRQGKKP